MIVRVYRRTVQAIADTRVATDDARIAKVCSEHDIPVLMTGDRAPTGTDRVHEAAAQLEVDMVINVQGDEPLVSADDIHKIVEAKSAFPDHIVNGMCPIEDETSWASTDVPKVVADPDGNLLYMSRAPIPMSKDGAFRGARRQVCIYGFTPGELALFAASPGKTPLERIEDIEILRFLELGRRVRMVEVSGSSIAVDRPEDIAKVEKALRES